MIMAEVGSPSSYLCVDYIVKVLGFNHRHVVTSKKNRMMHSHSYI